MNEQILQFGPNNCLNGIYTPPANTKAEAPTLICLNAGVLHRIGINRFHVKLAREMARCGN